MALIICPECGKEISDKAKMCIHCGYPLSEKVEVYSLFYNQSHDKNKTPGVLVNALRKLNICSHADDWNTAALIIKQNKPILERLSLCDVKIMQQKFEGEQVYTYYEKEEDTKIQSNSIKKHIEPSVPTCPKCGSTHIEATTRGFTLLTGFWGSGEPMNYCKNCGNKWYPTGK